MIPNLGEKAFEAKPEGDTYRNKFSIKAPSSSRQWSAFKNPRIVRVSRAFGGKDRHSKVCTVRGLRDRRIRLSVPTAIQLYDLQDRLGLSQPSKVVDWLLDNTKQEINKLPPLQMPPGNFIHLHQQTHDSNASHSSVSPYFNINSAYSKDGETQSLFSNKELGVKANYGVGDEQAMGSLSKLKEVERETFSNVDKTKWLRTNIEDGGFIQPVSAQNFFPVASHSSFPSFLSNANMPYNSYHHNWDHSSLSLSQFEGTNSGNLVSLPSPSSQFFLCPSMATPSMPSLHVYPPYMAPPAENTDSRQISNFLPNSLISSLQNSVSSPVNNAASKVLHLHSQHNERQPNKGSSTGA
ncbi:hypothetical protein NMG60_11023908 [Bertholletia excelsa]